MKKILLYLLIFISAYLVFVVVTMPAKFILSQLSLPKEIKVHGLSGTVWHSEIAAISNDYINVSDVKADLNFWSLFTLAPQLDIRLGDSLKPGPIGSLTAILSAESIKINNADIIIAANDVIANTKLPFPIDAKGDVELNITNFQLGKPICQELVGQISWPKAKLKAFEEDIMLGSLSGKLACDQGALMLTIDENNDLGLTYTAYVRKIGIISGEGYLQPGDKFPDNVRPALSFLGKPDNQGRYRLIL